MYSSYDQSIPRHPATKVLSIIAARCTVNVLDPSRLLDLQATRVTQRHQSAVDDIRQILLRSWGTLLSTSGENYWLLIRACRCYAILRCHYYSSMQGQLLRYFANFEDRLMAHGLAHGARD